VTLTLVERNTELGLRDVRGMEERKPLFPSNNSCSYNG
jgi:hypothetical protein